VATARVCATIGATGVLVGAQSAWPVNSSSGTPLVKTRVAPTTHAAVTHGPLAAGGGGSAQPATIQGAIMVTVGWPPTSTRGFVTVGVACPP
jgi:hypothetical protein